MALSLWSVAADAQQADSERRAGVAARTYVEADYSFTSFRGHTDPWQLASTSLGRRGALGSLIARLNYADRFDRTGGQFEVDAYPRLGSGTYAYLNAGYSEAEIFPDWRFGAEVFKSLSDAWEVSAGVRHLRFDETPVTLFTGSVGKYVGNYWLSARPFIRAKEAGTSASGSLTARRYFADADQYVGVRLGYGSTPSEQITRDEIGRVNSFSGGLHGSVGLRRNLLTTWSFGYDTDELSPGSTREGWSVSLGPKLIF